MSGLSLLYRSSGIPSALLGNGRQVQDLMSFYRTGDGMR
jgi:hypothetical protein